MFGKKSILIFLSLLMSNFSFAQDKSKEIISAIKKDDVSELKVLTSDQEDVDGILYKDLPILYYAIKYESNEVCKYLLRKGADANQIIDKYHALYWAIKNNRIRISRLLIEYGADVNAIDRRSQSMLINAARYDRLDICKILVDRGADPYYKDRKDKTALDHSLFLDPPLVKNYLESVMPQIALQDTVSSFMDGPYFYWENENELIQVYHKRDKQKNLTLLKESTYQVQDSYVRIKGKYGDTMNYHIYKNFTPKPAMIKTGGKILALGDIHGQLKALRKLLIRNQIIDSANNWIFEDGYLVLLGDVFDRGDLVTETLWFIYELEYKAKQAGGNVYLLLGNHEVMALTGDHRYLNWKYEYFSKYFYTYYYKHFSDKSVLGRWLRSQNTIITINGSMFLHAGISPTLAARNFPNDTVNSLVRNYLSTPDTPPEGSPQDFVTGKFGPLWYRGYVDFPGQEKQVTQDFVDHYLKMYNLKRMVVGHNEQYAIQALFNGKVLAIDVPFDRPGIIPQGLLIDGDTLYRSYSNGKKEEIKTTKLE